MELGVYCETIPPERLSAPHVLDLLGAFGLTLGHAARFEEADGRFDPDRIAGHLELAGRLREAGGRYALWPLLPKALGYWPNERNVDSFDRLADALLEGIRRAGMRPDWVVFDIEMPWQQMEAVFFPGPSAPRRAASAVHLLFTNRKPRRFAAAAGRFGGIARRFRAEGMQIVAAVFPFLVADLATGGCALQDYLEMPVFPVEMDAYNAMFYNSYIPRAVPLLVPPDAAQRFLFEYASLLAEKRPGRAWVTLGSTWEGVLPDNEGGTYSAAAQLAPDASAAKAAGVDMLWLYCLEGVLYKDQALTERRAPAESAAFFEVMRDAPAAEPAPHPRWTKNRRVMEFLLKDRFRSRYGW